MSLDNTTNVIRYFVGNGKTGTNTLQETSCINIINCCGLLERAKKYEQIFCVNLI